MIEPDFSAIPLDKNILRQKSPNKDLSWKSSENIHIYPQYSLEAQSGLEHLSYVAGLPPFLRGPYSSMYTVRPWTIRQYAGFSTAEESNAFYRRSIITGDR